MAFMSGLKERLSRRKDVQEEDFDEFDEMPVEDEDEVDGTYGDYPDYGQNGGYRSDEEDDYAAEAPAGARGLSLPLISNDDVANFLRNADLSAPAASEAEVTVPGAPVAAPEVPAAPASKPLYDPMYDEPPAEFFPEYRRDFAPAPEPLPENEAVVAAPPVPAAPVSAPPASAYVAGRVEGAYTERPAGTAPAPHVPAHATVPTVAPAAPMTGAFYEYASSSTRVAPVNTREMVVVKPTSFNDVETISDALVARTPVVLALRGVADDLSRRVLDFAFGAASVCGARVDTVANKVFVLFFDEPLNQYEILSLRQKGAL